MKTIAQLFSISIGTRFDYVGAVELFNYLNKEAIAAIELLGDAVIDLDMYPVEDEEQELRWYAERCRWDAEALKHYVEKNMWEYEEKDFVFLVDYIGNPLNDYQIESAKLIAKEKDKIRRKPALSWEDFCKLLA